MSLKKTLPQREKELQALLATSAGKEELQALAARYQETTGRLRATGTSPVTFILVHERVNGLIES
jgi:hypothetical protein